MEKDRIILGIDPGTQLLGFGIVRVEGKKPSYVDMGVLDLRKEPDAYAKLQAIYECIGEVCKSYHPTELAIESPVYGKNAQVVLTLGRAQGLPSWPPRNTGWKASPNMLPERPRRPLSAMGPPPRSRCN